jgi:uncharacterized membrane protein (UPF0182 family)
MEENLELALARLFGERKAPAGVASATPPKVTGSVTDLAKEAMSIYERAVNLQRQGNWGGYGEELKRLEQVLKQMAK